MAEPALTIVVFPSLSLTEGRWPSADRLMVWCPGCYAEEVCSTSSVPAAFIHNNDRCPTIRSIEKVLATFERKRDTPFRRRPMERSR